jgi:phenylacetate-CoA ligase
MYPLIARQVVFPLQERIKGKVTYAVLRKLEKSQWFPASRIQELQFERLKNHLEFAYQHVPYYRRLFDEQGTQPDRIKDFTDFRRIPFLTRESLREQFESLRASVPIRGVQKLSTGSSTGSPVTVLVDPVRNSFVDAARLRSHRWFNADMGVREIVLWGSPIEITRQDYLRYARDRLLNSRLLSAFNMGEANLANYSEIIFRYRPVKMYGYASALYLLARYFQETKRQPPRSLKVVFATAEPLFDFQRKAIEDAFDVRVAVEYGARDAGLMANECPNGGLHIPAEGMVVEVERSDRGVNGEIVVTNLYSRAMPIIRYRTGDIGELGSEPCSCGGGLPLLKKVEGRQTDFLVATDGRLLHALAVIYILREMATVKEFQVIQERLDRIVVRVVPEASFSKGDESSIVRKVRHLLGDNVEVVVDLATEIPRLPSGKFRYVTSHVATAYIEQLAGPKDSAGAQLFTPSA